MKSRLVLVAAVAVLAACGKGPTPPPPPVASVAVAPTEANLMVGDTVRLVATVKDPEGNVLTDRAVTWASRNPVVATVSGTGLVTGVRTDPQQVMITATSEAVSGSAGVTVTSPAPSLRFASVEAGTYHTCGRTPAGAAYCWGSNDWGELGNGTTANASAPLAVTGGLTFATVSVGGISSCGLTASGTAYCWGGDAYGELGAGTPGPDVCTGGGYQIPCSRRPLAVAGGLAFASLSAAWGLICGLDAGGAAYCWGENLYGSLGIGGDTATLTVCEYGGPCSLMPRAVAGGHTFTVLGAGTLHVCGLIASGAAYCWGDNRGGQLGIGTDTGPDSCSGSPCSRTPVPVAGGLTFTSLSVGYFHTCGLATDGAWYCWGSNNYGQLGNGTTGPQMCLGTTPCSTVPVKVAGGVSFATVFPGGWRHSCGVTSVGIAYCWGLNDTGQLGDGTTANSLTPVAVAGGLMLSSVSPYLQHTCGLTTGGVAYCWGSNGWGQLGNGTTTSSSVPVRVAGQTEAATAAASQASGVQRRSPPPPTPHRPLP